MAASTKEATLSEAAKDALDYLTLLYNQGDIDGQVGGEVMSQLASALEGSKTNLADANQNDPALSSQSLSLSEAREEIERREDERKRQLAINMENIDKAVAADKRADAAERACKAAWDSISRFPGSVHDRAMSRLERVLKGRNFDYTDPDLQAAEGQRDKALEAVEVAKSVLREAAKHTTGPLYLSITECLTSLRDATWSIRSALENGKAGRADANTNPPLSDLSSLRKGAEVAALDVATRALNRIASRQESHPVSAAFAAMTEIRALVSGSREEQ